MGYYRVLGLDREPFSTSPDPHFFYLSKEHDSALTNILIELNLKRGLSVILGDVGTGKTTMSRKLVQCLHERSSFMISIMLDPCFESEQQFLSALLRNFGMGQEAEELIRRGDILEIKEALQRHVYEKGVVEDKTVVLIIDEAQKLTPPAIEMLRVLLNYETNENKLLQLVLLGQLELYAKITSTANFFDRISFKYVLNPLGLEETKDLIQYRMERAGYSGKRAFFLDEAVELIHEISRGYPRKTTMLCHRALKNAVMKNKWAVDESIVREIMEEDLKAGWLRLSPR
jgi:general secretion pathway protein A